MITKIFITWTYVAALWSNLIAPCAFNPDNWEYCTKDLDVWLWPEIHRAWDLMQGTEKPYQQERDVLESNKVELQHGSDQPL
ncbi:hypothetical protein [Synechococcus phage S-N03]|uniref:Uncharacterized protein n=1 Tax=Synechococcus phage S-N03 TaxID=2718943 RepID=A0A6G8R5U5_9CAUD|nr:hypothetical protein PQC09_gp119 [Synechococcus phage S-N03]QIN96754.1 hypothetical protein [Synechococcus phage S-N03]